MWLPLAGLVVWLRRDSSAQDLPAATASLVRLLIWAAIIQLPLGLMAVLKAGGGLNSLHSVHYLLVALLILAFHAFAQPRPSRPASWLAPGLWWLVAVVTPLGNAVVFSLNPGSHWKVPHSHGHLVDLARQHPGSYYFPWNPLATLMAEHRIQPLDDALYCLWLARLEPPVEKICSAVPADPVILYEEPAQSHFALRYFPTAKSLEAGPDQSQERAKP